MATQEFVFSHGSHDNFRITVESGFLSNSWRIEPVTANCPLLVSGDGVDDTGGDLNFLNSKVSLILIEGASFSSVEGETGSGRVLQSDCSETGWTWLLDSVS